MAGTLDFEEYIVFCPECGENQEILMCVDYDPNDDVMPTDVSISGGTYECTECGHIITDADLEELEL